MSSHILPVTAQQNIARAFGLPDVSGIDLSRLDAESAAHLYHSIALAQYRADAIYAQVCKDVREAQAAAEAKLRESLHQSGGSLLAFDTLDVRLEKTVKRDKRFTRQDYAHLCELVPPDLLKDALVVSETRSVPPAKYGEAIASEDDAIHVTVDLRKLDVLARKIKGELAELVARCSPSVEVGQEKLVVEPRESALKIAGAS